MHSLEVVVGRDRRLCWLYWNLNSGGGWWGWFEFFFGGGN